MPALAPEPWRLPPDHVRHLCGSPAKVRLAPPLPPSPPAAATDPVDDLEALPDTPDERQRIELVLSAIARAGERGLTVGQLRIVTILSDKRVREVLRKERVRGTVTAEEFSYRPWVYRLAVARG